MDRFQALTAFARVVESGSFARAAARLGVSVSSVSRLVADLEAHLDSRLLNRTTRRLSLTESGQAFFERWSTPSRIWLPAAMHPAKQAQPEAKTTPAAIPRTAEKTVVIQGSSRFHGSIFCVILAERWTLIHYRINRSDGFGCQDSPPVSIGLTI